MGVSRSPSRRAIAGAPLPRGRRGEEQLVVLARRRGRPGARRRSGTAAASAARAGEAPSGERERHPARLGDVARVLDQSVAEVDARRRHAHQRLPRGRAAATDGAAGRAPRERRGWRLEPPRLGPGGALEQRQPQPRVAQRPRDPDHVPRAALRSAAAAGPGATSPPTVTRQRQPGGTGHVAADEHRSALTRQRAEARRRAPARRGPEKPRGTPSATSAQRGRAPSPPRSERFTASALWPTSASRLLARRKWTPSTTASTVTQLSPRSRGSTAASSPGPAGEGGEARRGGDEGLDALELRAQAPAPRRQNRSTGGAGGSDSGGAMTARGGGGLDRQHHLEARPLTELALHAHHAAVALDEALHDGQAQARAAELARAASCPPGRSSGRSCRTGRRECPRPSPRRRCGSPRRPARAGAPPRRAAPSPCRPWG